MVGRNPYGRTGRWRLSSIRVGEHRSYRISDEDHARLEVAVRRFRGRNPDRDLVARRLAAGYSRVEWRERDVVSVDNSP